MSASSNWVALKKNLTGGSSRPSKRRKVETVAEEMSEASSIVAEESKSVPVRKYTGGSRDTAASLRQMINGEETYSSAHQLPGKFIAIDCEMVGIAGDPSKQSLATRDKGDESSLARVSVVNYHGAVQLDVFVRQRERVTDWRTEVSGVRESDMTHAKPFSEVQKLVADLFKNRILVGHAVHNDLKVLLLSHPHNLTRDTQILAGRHGTLSTPRPSVPSSNGDVSTVKVSVNRKPALRKLVLQELGVNIQAGEHSSVTDARATMAIYRLHRKTWDKGFIGLTRTLDAKQTKAQLDSSQTGGLSQNTSQSHLGKRKRNRAEQPSTSDNDAEEFTAPEIHKAVSGKQNGISSGLSVVVKKRKSGTEVKQLVSGIRNGRRSGTSGNPGDKWWGTLGS